MSAPDYDAHVAALVAAAPPLTAAQVDRLRPILSAAAQQVTSEQAAS